MSKASSLLLSDSFDACGSLWEFDDVVEYVDGADNPATESNYKQVLLDADGDLVKVIEGGAELDSLRERFRLSTVASAPLFRPYFVWTASPEESGYTLWAVDLMASDGSTSKKLHTSWVITTSTGRLIRLNSSTPAEAAGEFRKELESLPLTSGRIGKPSIT